MGEVLQLHLAHLTLPNGVDDVARCVIIVENKGRRNLEEIH
jgi:hypothetical protein|tara:strand:+ start:557 stop:679 length:123 start_codon:yes stop_codon:yes gene_type:complete